MPWKTTQPSLLLRLCNATDHAAWDEFDRTYGEMIVRYASQRGMQRSDAEDVRQLVLMSISRVMKHFRYAPERGKFRHYLGRVVRNAIIQYARRPTARHEVALSDEHLEWAASELSVDAADDDAAWESEWIRHHLRMAMEVVKRSTDPRHVEVLELFLAGKTAAEIAEATGMTAAAVNKIKQRMRDRLKEQVALQVRQEDELD